MMFPLGILTALLFLTSNAAFADVEASVSPATCTHAVNHSETFNANYTTANCESTQNDTVTYQWSVDGAVIQGATGSSFTYTASVAGLHTIACTVTVGICGAGKGIASETAVSVGFSPSSIRTGFTKPTNTIKPVSAVATVVPANMAGNVTITHTGADRVAISITKVDTTAGTISFTMTGTSGTAANAPTGDETIVGQVRDENTGSLKVIIVVPTTVSQTKQTVGPTNCPGVNRVRDANSVPPALPDSSCPAGKEHLYTDYNMPPVTITVKDQFGIALDSIYAGVKVYEAYPTQGGTFSTPGPLNVSLSSSGTYQDTLGVSQRSPDPSLFEVLTGSAAAVAWPTQPTLPINDPVAFTLTFQITVGGFSLSPSLVRDISFAPPSTLTATYH